MSEPQRALVLNDSEVNVATCDRALARDTRHATRDCGPRISDEIARDPSTVIDELWRPIPAEQRERRNRGDR